MVCLTKHRITKSCFPVPVPASSGVVVWFVFGYNLQFPMPCPMYIISTIPPARLVRDRKGKNEQVKFLSRVEFHFSFFLRTFSVKEGDPHQEQEVREEIPNSKDDVDGGLFFPTSFLFPLRPFFLSPALVMDDTFRVHNKLKCVDAAGWSASGDAGDRTFTLDEK